MTKIFLVVKYLKLYKTKNFRPEISEASDLFQPSRVLDLAAIQTDVNDVTKGISLQFTAPGDDFDVGQGETLFFHYYNK